jgi:NAD(P)-dependent dehydrogenase (short-subunit alcohol dehydrogenase family)
VAASSIFDLSGRVAVVTGGSKGIGFGMARGLARAGADVAIWSRNPDQGQAAAADLEKLGVRALPVPCDIASETSIQEACAATIEKLGRIDSCFANAGFGDYYNPLKASLERWRKVLDVNLDGTFVTFREVAKHMVERGGGGKLVAISSITERFGAAKQPGYAASKAALGALVRSFAIELARHDIQVNNLQPGWIETDATEPMRDNELLSKTVIKRTPAQRWGDPSDFEGIAVYLASDASRFHTGDTLCVDGGYSIF